MKGSTPKGMKNSELEWQLKAPKRLRFKKRWSKLFWRLLYKTPDALMYCLRTVSTARTMFGMFCMVMFAWLGIFVVTFGLHLLRKNAENNRHELPTTEQILQLDHERDAKK